MATNNAADDDDGQIQNLAAIMQYIGIDIDDIKKVKLSPRERQNLLLNHIILPHFLPDSNAPQFHSIELQLFDEMIGNVLDLSECIPSKTVALFQSIHKIHHKLTPKDVSKEINALQPGDTFAMFVRRQNCTFMIYVPPDVNIFHGRPQNAIVATFPGCLHPNEVYRCDSDIEYTYPQQAIKVKFSRMLRSEEFAHQLCFMYHSLPIESKNRNYISKWLVSVLGDEHSHSVNSEDFQAITKKVRDELLGETTKSYFRRSSFYTVMKVLLQHSLTIQMGIVFGEMMYKCVMLKFLIRICGFYKSETEFNTDLLSQMIAKMARRVEKLKTLFAGATDPYLIDMYDVTVQEARDLIATIRMKIDEQINETIALNVELPPLNGLNFIDDIEQKMPKLAEYLQTRKEIIQNPNNVKYQVKSYERFAVQTNMDPKGDAMGIRVHWMEFEKSILNGKFENEWSPTNLFNLSIAYSKYAEATTHNGDPLLISRMILIRLKLICQLDQYACKECPILLQHHSGINPKIIASLLLPQRIDVKLANELEQYFTVRNENAIDPSLIGEREISKRSFSTKFARANTEMKRIRDTILQIDQDNLKKKEIEVAAVRGQFACLRTEAGLYTCEFQNQSRKHPIGRKKRAAHLANCKKCRLEHQANAIKLEQYERLLPADQAKQFAIVFELCIPKTIAYLRDTLHSFTRYCNPSWKDDVGVKIKFEWTAWRPDITRYRQSTHKCSVRLGNTTKYDAEALPMSSTVEKFEMENKRNCVFYDDSHYIKREIPTSIPEDVIKSACTFQIENEYSCLQWTLNSTNHSQNQVLAQQSQCPDDLTLAEYKNFGSLRADGHRLQLRNLYAMIETDALSFENEAVLMLIMQSLWECGVKGDTSNIRESHVDFSNPKFCNEFIQLLKKYIDQQQCNWKHPFKMIMTVLIAVRAFELNNDATVADEIVELLNSIRFMAVDWIDKISNAIHGMENPDETVERELRLKLIYVGVAGALTFFIHPKHKHFKRIFNVSSCGRFGDGDDNHTTDKPTASILWLQYIITVKNNTLIYTTNDQSLPLILRMFLRLIECIGVYLEPSIKTKIQQNPTTINHLIRKLWTHDDRISFSSLEFHTGKYPHIFIAKSSSESRIITIDIITGIFLVNGFPVGRLPSDIIRNNAYERFFGDVTFEVMQPDASTNYATVQRYNGCSYGIQRNGKFHIIITERQANGVEKELIDHTKLSDDFPHLLVHDYSHWLNKSTKCIEFRRRALDQKHFSKETTVDYVLDLKTKRLSHVKTERFVLDVGSYSYKNIVGQLTRLEHPNYIHILIHEDTPELATVELMRMNLKFKVDVSNDENRHYEIESCEFNGMQVSRQQNVGTLYGLDHGLILESSNNAQNRILLIPHGNIQCKRTETHVTVHINTDNELRHPPFFQYKIDEFCRQIKSNNRDYTSWFYLAYLHAVTSHGQLEPFTGTTGTERAIQILQSAYAWSSAPYEAEAIKMLEQIAELSPRRQMNENRQTAIWPAHIQPHAAQDCFIFIAQKLFADSQRLHGLYFKETADVFKEIETDFALNARDHHRCHALNPNLCVSNQFIEHKELMTSPVEKYPDSYPTNAQVIAALYHRQQYIVPQFLDLKSFLLNDGNQLIGLADGELNILDHAVYDDFRNLWIRLYDAARKRLFNPEQFALILSVYAHRGVNIDAILALQAVAMNPNAFEQIDPPLVNEYDLLSGMYMVPGMIYGSIIKHYERPPHGQHIEQELQLQAIVNETILQINQCWPCDFINLIGRWYFPGMNFAQAQLEINMMLLSWSNNRQLFMFIDQIEQQLRLLPASGMNLRLPNYIILHNSPLRWPKTRIDFDDVIKENLNEFPKICTDAKHKWLKNKTKSEHAATANEWWLKLQRILNSDGTKHLIDAGLFPRLVPSLLLPKILQSDIDERLKNVIGAWAIAIAREQRQHRIQSYSKRPELKAAMDREIENKPHCNWSPCERPEWLLFEIEQNLTIRRIQVEVANCMMNPPKTKDTYARHSVMQLNMGEGKTAVIVPILASILGDGTQACQITVLKSLFASNLNSLRQYLGGFLNRRIYTFPCRRDMPIGQHISQLLDIYKECMMEKGVILTLPEYRLSFQLKMYEAIQKSDIDMAHGILTVLKWFNQNIRNILDESDAILQPKYQLVYTVGNQMPPDGAELRWKIAQAVLKRVPHHMKQLYVEYGKDHIEFDDTCNDDRPDKFTPCRILNENMFELLKTKLIDDFLSGELRTIDFPDIVPSKKDAVRKILMNKVIDKSSFEVVDSFLLSEQNTILILSGSLRFEVLKLVLTKRWRVNYGVDGNGHRKMAVPFRAKDVAMETSEFGHPDVAICFTQLSYYYSGLSDVELIKVFSTLENDPNAKVIYEEWIRSIPSNFIDPTIQTYDGINLEDVIQRDNILFPLLRSNMHVIDFYLSNIVFRHEMKIFENKLICTAWDLCSDRFAYLVTGFSGTNDTKDILPLPIAQNDLKELENTNKQMREILLQPKNQAYVGLPANVSGMEILERLIGLDIAVLLDSGALMLELNNKEVAQEWLKLASFDRFDASVYFDSRDILQTVDRNGIVTAFDCSVYRENLGRCLVYLDDVHTRGTDLKFPLNWKACVTLCGDIQRDKTVQSCMRMRQLGKTHSISFWASYEADTRIRSLCGLSPEDRVENEHVIEFISNNSKRFELTNMSHWTAAALNYTKKVTAHKLFEATVDDENAMNDLYGMCVDNEFVELSKMYGEKDEALITEIATAQFAKLASDPKINDAIKPFIEKIQSNVNDKLSKKAPQLKQFTNCLDEEQEKELEYELEEQRYIERPPAAVAAEPLFDERLKKLVQQGAVDDIIRTLKMDGVLVTVPRSLSHTQLYQLVEKDSKAWAKHILVTKEFQTVIVSLTSSCDAFLRPVWWIAKLENTNGADLLMLLSPYECNLLLPEFRTSKQATLFPYRPRLSKFHSNLLHKPALQVTGMDQPQKIDIHDEIQIGIYSGSMYFSRDAEMNAYCNFLGLIPRPRSIELQTAFEQQIIQTNGFVPKENRRHSPAIYKCVGQCKFKNNPVDLAVKLIEANHQSSAKFSHAACILKRGMKPDDAEESGSSSPNEFEIVQQIQLEEELDEHREEVPEDLNAADIKTAASSNCQIQ